MGNTVARSRIFSIIKQKYPVYLPLQKKTRLEHFNPINIDIIKDLITRKMAPARGRAPKVAATSAKSKAEKVPEIEEDSDQEMEETPVVEQKKAVGKGRKLKETAKEDVAVDEDIPMAKRGRRVKAVEEKVDEDKSKEKKAAGKGKKKEEEEEVVEEDTKKKTQRGKKPVTIINKDEENNDEEVVSKAKRGGKKAAPKESEMEAEKKPSARGRKKPAQKEEEEEADEEELPAKTAGKRGKKATVKSADGENGASTNGKSVTKNAGKRGKKTAAVVAASEEQNSSAEEEEIPVKPVAKRGKKIATAEEGNGVVAEEIVENITKPVAKRGRKVAAAASSEMNEEKNGSADEEEAEIIPSKRTRKPAAEAKKPAEKKTKAEAKVPKNKVETNLDEINFDCERENAKGEKANFKIVSWNVGGARAVVKKMGVEYLLKENADVIVMQETKATEEQMNEVIELPGYKFYYVDSVTPGYAGAALYSKSEPLNIKYGIENSECNNEGRLITAEFEKFFIINVYVPNSGKKLVSMDKRLQWNKDFKAHIKELDAKKPVFICGDMNVAHQEIDLANPKTNTKNAGFTKEERDGLTDFLAGGFVDTFRELYPEKSDAYTFWSYMNNARGKNVGWRLDYFIVSQRLKDNICDNIMRSEVFGSDHCPIVLFANV